MPKVTSLEEIPENRKRRHVVFADAPTVELSLEVACAAGLLPGRTVSRAAVRKAQKEDALRRAEEDALALLRRKDRSEAELRRALASAGHGAEVVEAILKKCRGWGYLDDRRLAERLVSDGIELKHLGPARIKRQLRERGLDPALGESVRKQVAGEEPSLVERAVAALASKRKSYARLEPEVARRRMIAFLERRGFDFDTIRKALKRVGHEADDDTA